MKNPRSRKIILLSALIISVGTFLSAVLHFSSAAEEVLPPAIGEIRNTKLSRISEGEGGDAIYTEELEYGSAINSDAKFYPGSLRFHIKGGVFADPPRHGDNPNPPLLRLSGTGIEGITAYGGMELQYDGTYEPYGVIEWPLPSAAGEIRVSVVDNLGQISENTLILNITVTGSPPAVIRVPEDYNTIGEALSHTRPGDTVSISAGSYEFYKDLTLNGVNLIGESVDVTEIRGIYPIIVSSGIARAPAIWTGSNSTIKDLTIHSNIILQNATNSTIKNCIIEAQPAMDHFGGRWFEQGAIRISGSSSSNIISNNLIYGDPSLELFGSNNNIRNNILVEYNNLGDSFLYPPAYPMASNIIIGGADNKAVNNVCALYLTPRTLGYGPDYIHNISIAAVGGHFVGTGNDVRNNIFRIYNKGKIEFKSIGLCNGVYEEPLGSVMFDYNFISDPSSAPIPGVTLGGNNVTTAGGPLFVKDLFSSWKGIYTLLSLDFHLQPASPCIDKGDPAPEYNDIDSTRNDMGAYGGPLGSWDVGAGGGE